VSDSADDSARLEAALQIVLAKVKTTGDATAMRARMSSLVSIWGRLRPDLTASQLAATVIRINQLL
jgi:hypothetical protein